MGRYIYYTTPDSDIYNEEPSCIDRYPEEITKRPAYDKADLTYMTDETNISPFHPRVGNFIQMDVVNKLVQTHKEGSALRGPEGDPLYSIFYGKEKLQALLDHPDAIGIRIHFGIHEDGATKLILSPADKNGSDLPMFNSAGEVVALDCGMPCPTQCPPPPPPIKVPQ